LYLWKRRRGHNCLDNSA